MATDPNRDDEVRGVKSYDAPARPRASSTGRIIGIVVAIILVVLLLYWIF